MEVLGGRKKLPLGRPLRKERTEHVQAKARGREFYLKQESVLLRDFIMEESGFWIRSLELLNYLVRRH